VLFPEQSAPEKCSHELPPLLIFLYLKFIYNIYMAVKKQGGKS